MTDLRDRFGELDRLDAPDMRAAIDQRVAELQSTTPGGLVRTSSTGWRGPLIAFGTAVAILVVTAAVVLLLRGDEWSVEPAGTVPTPSVTTTVPTTRPATDPSEEAAFTLIPVAGVDPMRVSTVFGDIEFVTMRLPPNEEFDFYPRVTATPYGPIAVEGSTVWWSADYQTWQTIPIDMDADRVDLVGDDLVVSDMRSMTRLAWDGNRWRVVERVEILDRETPSTIDHLAFGPRGVVAANLAIIYFSTDGTTFTRAEHGPDLGIFVASDEDPEDAEYVEAARMDCRGTFGAARSLIRGVVATDAGFVAFTAASHPGDDVCAPLLWFSPDGNTWELVSPESPFGELTALDTHNIAERGGRFIVVGGIEAGMQGLVWVSDDALTWQEIDLNLDPTPTVDAGDLGWVLTGGKTNVDGGMWFSTDGYTWDGPHPLPDRLVGGYFRPELVVGTDTILGVGFQEQVLVIGQLQQEAQGG